MRDKVLSYYRQKKLLCVLVTVYIVLCSISLIYIHYNGQKLVTAGSPIAKITQKLGLGEPVAVPPEIKKPSNTSNNSSSNSTSDSNSNSNPDTNGSSTNNLTATVAFYSDTQEDTDEEDSNHSRVAEYLLFSGANPIFHAGDVMEDGTQNSMDRFASVTESLRSARSFYPALGNNDRNGSSPSSIFLDFFSQPTYYAVNAGNLHLVILDSAFESMAPGSSQYNWLSSDLDNQEQSKIVGVMFHHPDSASNVSSLLTEKHVDFVVSGHVHSYSESTSGGVHYFTCSGQPLIGYLKAYVYENNVLVKAYDSNNGLIDSVDITNR